MKKSKIQQMSIGIIALTIGIFFLSGCGGNSTSPSKNQTSKKSYQLPKNLPKWFFKAPKNSDKLYGVGISKKTNNAVNNALIDMISNITLSVTDKSLTSSKVTKGRGQIETDEVYISETILKVKKTFTSEYFIEKMKKVGGEKVILLSVTKEDFINTTLLTIDSLNNNLNSVNLSKLKNENILKRIKAINAAINTSKKIDYLASILQELKYKYPKNKQTKIYTAKLNKELKNIKIYFQTTMDSKTFPDMNKQLSNSFRNIFSPIVFSENQDKEISKKAFRQVKLSKSVWITKTALSPNSKYALLGDRDGFLYFYNLQKKKLIRKTKADKNQVLSIAISGNSKYALSSSLGTLKYWNLRTGKLIRSFRVRKEGQQSFYQSKNRYMKNDPRETKLPKITAIKFFSNSRYALTGSDWGTIRKWDLKRGKEISNIDLYHRGKIFAGSRTTKDNKIINMDLSLDQKYVAVGTDDMSTIFVDLKSKKTLATLTLPSRITAISISPDSNYLLVSYGKGNISYWNHKTQKSFTWNVLKGFISNISFSPDSKYGYIFSSDKIKIINLKMVREKKPTQDIIINGEFGEPSISNNNILAFDKEYDSFRLYKLRDKALKKAITQSSKSLFDKNSIIFDFSSCAVAYLATEKAGIFGNTRGVEIYDGCIKVSVRDSDANDMFSKRLKGKQIKSYDRKKSTLAKATNDSYYSSENQQAIKSMIEELKAHELLTSIMRDAK